ncbi:MAG: META domain-containing protein [Roseovarius sp.]|nr:META domain-containing protein [Roseovarius sp.]
MSRALALSGLIVALSAQHGDAQEPDLRKVRGAVEYLQRIALPPEANLHVVVEGRFGVILGETQIKAGGQQVPLAFTLTIPSELRGDLSAVIRLGNAPRWIARDIAINAGSDAVDLGDIRVEPVTPLAFSTVIRCEDQQVEIGVLGEEMALRADGRDIALRETVSASGARYEGVNDPATVVWSRGDEISIQLDGIDLESCREVLPPDRRPYRARGIEPGWHVDLGEDSVAIVADYGALTRKAARPTVGILPGTYRFDMPEAGASLRIEEGLCRDAATGMPYPDRATLVLDDRRLDGCGGDPLDLLNGETWQVTRLDGEAPHDPERVAITFLTPARVAGSTGCNRFVGGFTLTGEGLAFGALGSTMMACTDVLMDQERRMLDALEQISRFDIGEDGSLLLIGGPRDEVLIEAAR